MAVLVIVFHPPTGIFPLLGVLHRMCVVVPHNPIAVGLMQRQAIFDAMRPARCCVLHRRLDLYPVPAILVDDVAIQVEQGIQTSIPGVKARLFSYHLVISIGESQIDWQGLSIEDGLLAGACLIEYSSTPFFASQLPPRVH